MRGIKYRNLTQKQRYGQISQKIIAVTGGIASGKSLFMKRVSQAGYFVVLADDLVKEAYLDKVVIERLGEIIPGCIERGQVLFPVVREAIFSSEELRKKVENLVHPKVHELFLKKVLEREDEVIFYEIPLLFEKGMKELFDYIVLIYAEVDTQLERIVEKRKIPREDAQKIIAKQLPAESKIAMADYVIKNSGTLEDFDKRIQEFCLLMTQ